MNQILISILPSNLYNQLRVQDQDFHILWLKAWSILSKNFTIKLKVDIEATIVIRMFKRSHAIKESSKINFNSLFAETENLTVHVAFG